MNMAVTPASDIEAPSSIALASGKIRLEYIDGLRALALVMVLLDHCWLSCGMPWFHWWNILGNGYTGVNLFLTLSGFCLYWPMISGTTRREPTLWEFARRRAHRLLPPYYIALLLFAGAEAVFHYTGHSWPDNPNKTLTQIGEAVIWHAGMLHNLRPEYIGTIDGALWSLALEVNLYIAMPILVVIARKQGIISAICLAVCVTLAYRFWINWFAGGSPAWEMYGHNIALVVCCSLPGRWLEFALGMWAAKLVADGHSDKSPKMPYGWLAIGCILLAFLLAQKFGIFNPASDAIDGLGFFFLILYASRHNQGAGKFSVSALLRHPLAVNLGIISYSVYLIHQPLLRLAVDATRFHVKHNSLEFFVSVLIFVPVIILISRVFFRFCEQPFINKPKKNAVPILQEQPAA